jgi:hypothetical protein
MTNGRRASDTFKPKHTTLALTEYAASPTPQLGTPHERNLNPGGVPEDLLLPNGYPDVSEDHNTLAQLPSAVIPAPLGFESSQRWQTIKSNRYHSTSVSSRPPKSTMSSQRLH